MTIGKMVMIWNIKVWKKLSWHVVLRWSINDLNWQWKEDDYKDKCELAIMLTLTMIVNKRLNMILKIGHTFAS